MTAPVIEYPYNPLCVKSECLILNERGNIPSHERNDHRAIVPELTPFFQEGLVIRHVLSKKELVFGKDYILGYGIPEYKHFASKPVYGAIVIINREFTGDVEYDYNTLGHPFVGIRSEVMTYLAGKMVNPITTVWDSVIDKADFFAPQRHYQSWYDFVNKEDIALAIDRLTAKLVETGNSNDGDINDIVNEINTINTLLDTVNFKAHTLDYGNPHNLQARDVNALALGADAADTNKIEGQDLVAFARYVKSQGVVMGDVEELLHKYASEMVSTPIKLDGGIVSDGASIRTRSQGDSSLDIVGNKGIIIKTR